jgi:hypothetical protein
VAAGEGVGSQVTPHVDVGSGVGDSACTLPAAERPMEMARTPAPAVTEMARNTDGGRYMATFSTARGPLRCELVFPASLLQHAGRQQIT